MNSVNLIGRLTADPDVRNASNENAMAKFTLAVDRSISSDKKHELEEDGKQTADFPRIVVWGRQADNVQKYLKKGDRVGVCGRVVTGRWNRDDGSTVYTTEIAASNIQFLMPVNKSEEKQ